MKAIKYITVILISILATYYVQAKEFDDIKSSPNQEMKLYPNPVTDNQFTISSEIELVEIKVINVLGQQVYQQKVFNEKTYRVQLETNEKGLYLVQIRTSDNHEITKRVLFK